MSVIHCPGLPESAEAYLGPTEFFDYEHPTVRRFIDQALLDTRHPGEPIVKLFYAVRDRIRYDPYHISFDPHQYRASRVIESGHGWCVSKAGLLAACARAIGVASAVGLADVVNHLNTEKLKRRMGGVNVFYDHGYAALHVNGVWIKAVPAFNIELCEKFGVRPTEFDGRRDALYQEFDLADRRHMEYLADHGTWSDLPLETVKQDFARHYPASIATAGEGETERFEDGARTPS